MKIILGNQVSLQINRDAVKTFPEECCGFLFGTASGERIITASRAAKNLSEGDKKTRFAIGPKDYLTAEQWAEENELELVGIYHSHPDHPAIPSEHDRLAAQPFFSYVIVSIINKNYTDTRSWRLNENSQFEEETVKFQ